MKREDAVALVTGLLSAARQGDIARLTQFYADDAVIISPMFGEVRGRQAIGATWLTLFNTAPDFRAEISHILVDGDQIAVLSAIATTDRGGWFGLPATGGPIGYKLVLLFTVVDGLVTRDERIYDSAGVIERLEKARLDRELRTAAEVQRTLLSQTTHDGRRSRTVGDSVPCRAIGGDFFDFIDFPSGDVGIVMGDVAGKGPAAALLAAMVQGMFAVEAPSGVSPSAAMTRINRHLVARHLESRFATVFYGILAPDGRFVYSNAGHNPPALLADGHVRRLVSGGPIVGAFGDAAFEESTIALGDGDTLVLFTDGVTEARNRRDEEFGEDRLLACLRAHRQATPDDLLRRVFAEVRAFCDGADPTDDITVTVTRVGAVNRDEVKIVGDRQRVTTPTTGAPAAASSGSENVADEVQSCASVQRPLLMIHHWYSLTPGCGATDQTTRGVLSADAAGAMIDVDGAGTPAAAAAELESTADLAVWPVVVGRFTAGRGCATGAAATIGCEGSTDGVGAGADAGSRGATTGVATTGAGAALRELSTIGAGALGAVALDADGEAMSRAEGIEIAKADADCHPPSGR